MMIRGLFVALCILASPQAAAGQPQGSGPLDADKAFAVSAERTASGALRLNWRIADGYYLYRDRIGLTTQSKEPVSIETIPGEPKEDPYFGRLEVYHSSAEATIPAKAVEAAGDGEPLVLTYQGCQEDGICYRPQTKRLNVRQPAILGPDGGGGAIADRASGGTLPAVWQRSSEVAARAPDSEAAPVAVPAVQENDASALEPSSGNNAIRTDGSTGLVDELLGDGGGAWVIAVFFALGLGLGFTPCVLPMYPILAGQLARSGQTLSTARGFVLSSSYVLAMAAAFAMLGVAAAWSGQNLQMALQSDAAIIAVAGIFAVLALSMFGLFELRLPAAWSNRIGAVQLGQKSSVMGSAALGFTSALIVGPCVTAPLAGALLYIAKSGDVALGAASLFALGVGQGMPLIAFGTAGAGVLPKPGPWMTNVTRGFGLVFLALAIWMLSRILPGAASLFLWSVLLICTGVFIGAFDRLASVTTPQRRLAQAAGIVAVMYGAILGIGAASGGTDLLNPLAQLASANPVERQAPDFEPVRNASEFAARVGGSERPTLVYVTADWCTSCEIIKRNVFSDRQVAQRMAGLQLLKIDVTEMDADRTALMRELGVVGPPTMLFLDRDHQEPSDTRLIGEISPQQFIEAALRAAGSVHAIQ